MALVRIPDENRTIDDAVGVRDYLAERGIEYERWTPTSPIAADTPAE